MSGTSRRDTLASLAGFLAVPALPSRAAADEHPDAALLAYRPAVLSALAAGLPHRAEMDRLDALAETAAGLEPRMPGKACRAWHARVFDIREQNGATAAWDRWTAAIEPCDPIRDALAVMPARTLDGLCLKALVATKDPGEADQELLLGILDDLLAIEAGGRS